MVMRIGVEMLMLMRLDICVGEAVEMAMVMGAGDCDGDDGGGGDDGGDAGDGDAKEEALTGMVMGLAMGKMMVMVNGYAEKRYL